MKFYITKTTPAIKARLPHTYDTTAQAQLNVSSVVDDYIYDMPNHITVAHQMDATSWCVYISPKDNPKIQETIYFQIHRENPNV